MAGLRRGNLLEKLGTSRSGFGLLGISIIYKLFLDNFFFFSPSVELLCGVCCAAIWATFFIRMLGFWGVYRGRAELGVKHANWVVLGFLIGILACLFGIILDSITPSPLTPVPYTKLRTFTILAGTVYFFNRLSLFLIVYNVFSRKGKKVISIIFCLLLIVVIMNLIIMAPKLAKYNSELNEYLEGEPEPDNDEILQKYHDVKKPLIPHRIIISVEGLVISILLFVVSFTFNKARNRPKPNSFHIEEEEEEEEEEDEKFSTSSMNEKKVKCPKCEWSNDPAYTYCMMCGTPLKK